MNPKVSAAAHANSESSLYSKAKQYIQKQNYTAALQLIGNPGHDVELKNARGVCLLRLGRKAEAVQMYRALLLRSGCITIRPDLPTCIKANFATALLLSGQIEGFQSALTQAQDDQNRVIMRLRSCLKQWEKKLTMSQWLQWKFGTLSAAQSAVPLDFLPGVLSDDEIIELPTNQAISSNGALQPGSQGYGI